jgi:hypothetical protein
VDKDLGEYLYAHLQGAEPTSDDLLEVASTIYDQNAEFEEEIADLKKREAVWVVKIEDDDKIFASLEAAKEQAEHWAEPNTLIRQQLARDFDLSGTTISAGEYVPNDDSGSIKRVTPDPSDERIADIIVERDALWDEVQKLKSVKTDPILEMESGRAAEAIFNNGDTEWAEAVVFALDGLWREWLLKESQKRMAEREKEWEAAQREQYGDDWRERSEHHNYEEYHADLITDKPDPIAEAKAKFHAMVKLAFHPATTTAQAVAAIEGARRWAETFGVSIIDLTDKEYLAIDDVILVKVLRHEVA